MCDSERTSASLLIKLTDHRDELAWQRFVDRYRSDILNVCCRVGLDAASADEITSEVLTVLARTMSDFEYDPAKGRFRAFLDTVVRNKIRDLWRARARQPDRAVGGSIAKEQLDRLQDAEVMEPAIESMVSGINVQLTHDLADVRAAVDAIQQRAPKTWQVFELRELRQLDYREIADQLGMKLATVYVRVNQAKKMLKEHLACCHRNS